ncbi:Crp/Fnr family transcriptional regulator [Rummeliibacillus pycnus]|uniref:Crp/Fnr family transcriptional regulator n=1 Tax=Rummeliibacillus pycnus TaxID=101070 RepID=UPI003D2C8BCA
MGVEEDMVTSYKIEPLPVKIRKIFEENGSTVKVSKGSHLCLEGEPVKDIFYVVSGKVILSKETVSGKELTLRICGNNDCIGEGIIFSKTGYYPLSAKALENANIITLDKNLFEMCLSQEPDMLIECIKWLQLQNLKSQTKLRDLLLYGKKGALYSTIIRLTNTYGIFQENGDIEIDYPLTNSDLANLCATSREVINRMLNELKKSKVISFDKSIITVHNLNYLKDACECENCPASVCRID